MRVNRNQFTNIIVILTIVCSLLLAACGGGGGNGGPSDGGENPYVISGAAVKGMVKGGTVKVYQIVNGQKGELLGKTTTSVNDGSYSITIGTYTGPVLVEVTGGTYGDEATGRTISLYGTTLRAALGHAENGSTVVVTPLTEFAVRMAEPNDGLMADKIDNANKMISQLIDYAGTGDRITQIIPVDASIAGASNASKAAKEYGLLLAAISQLAKNNISSVTEIIKALADDLKDNKLDNTGNNLVKALNDFVASDNNKTGIHDAGEMGVDESLGNATNTGLKPTGNLASCKTRLATFLQEPTEENYNTFMDYMDDFVPQSKEAYLFTAIAQLFALYIDNDIDSILTALGINLDTNFEALTNEQVKGIIGAIITTSNTNLDKILAATITRLAAVDGELALAEGVNKTSISLTGFDTVYLDDIDVKTLRTFTTALKAALTYLQAVNLTGVGNWNVTLQVYPYTIDIRDLLYSDAYEVLRDSLSDAEEVALFTQFLNNNPNLFTYKNPAKLVEFQNLFTTAVNRYDVVMDALNTLGSSGRDARFQNAFNISSDAEFYSMLGINEHTLPSFSAAMNNPAENIVLIDDDGIAKRYVVIDGYAYKQETLNIFRGDYTPVGITIHDLASGDKSPRDLIQASLLVEDYEMYQPPAGIGWVNWTLYKHGVTSIDWVNPIDTYTVPVANISVTDGRSDDWAGVPTFYSNSRHEIKLARDNNNYFYIYIHGISGESCTGTWGSNNSYYLDGMLPDVQGNYEYCSINHWFWQDFDGSDYYSDGETDAYDSILGTLATTGEQFKTSDGKVIGGETRIEHFNVFVRPGSCNYFSWNEILSCNGEQSNSYYSSSRKQLKLLPEIN